MATYKLIQDIEAEDKLLGPLTLRQFIYAGVSAVLLYLSFLSLTKHAGFLLLIFLPPALLAGFFGFPWGRDQPTEVWALAKIRFLLKPHRRIWDQSGTKELVTITAPKILKENYTNGLSQTEVRSRLTALADTIDSRGWAIKNINVNLYSQPIPGGVGTVASDRLLDPNSFPQEVSNIDIQATDDILDEQNNPTAHLFDQMIKASTKSHRQKLTDQLNREAASSAATPANSTSSTAAPNDYWFLNQPPASQIPRGSAIFNSQVIAPGTDVTYQTNSNISAEDEQAIDEELKAHHVDPEISYSHIKTIQPLSKQTAKKPPVTSSATQPVVAPPPTTQTPNPAIIDLASNNDLNVATIARQINRKDQGASPDEVVVSLH
jgi:hypothetical protein